MFTGLIEAVGTLQSIRPKAGIRVLDIQSPVIVDGLKLGDSVAVNGACLTVVSLQTRSFSVEALGDTLTKTTIGNLKTGAKLNLERSVRVGGRLDGHFVQGHVNGVAHVEKWEHGPDRHFLTLGFDAATWAVLRGAIIPEGSIAIDGTSLTVAGIGAYLIRVSLIPHTLASTTLGALKNGDRVNIETDILLRGAAMAVQASGEGKPQKKSTLTPETLAGWGYL